MKYKLKNHGIKAGITYEGVITRHIATKEKLLVYVELEREKGTEFVYVIPVEEGYNSNFSKFAQKMEIVDEHNVVDTDSLNEVAVKVILKQGKDGCLYVNSMEIDYAYYENQEEDEEDSDE